jgi:hypothetical protein
MIYFFIAFLILWNLLLTYLYFYGGTYEDKQLLEQLKIVDNKFKKVETLFAIMEKHLNIESTQEERFGR